MRQTFAFGPWAPDAPVYGGDHLVEAQGVVYRGGSYRALRTFGGLALGAIPARVVSATGVLAGDNTVEIFAGTAAQLWWRSGAGVFADASPNGVTFSAPMDFGWSFAQFGRRVIASNVVDGAFRFDLGVDSRFAALPNAPAGKVLALIGDHLMMGDVREGAERRPWRVQWSGFNNTEIWGVDPINQADFQDLDPSHGAVQAIVGGDYIAAFQSRSVSRVMRVGGDVVFRFDVVDRERGAWAGRSVVRVGNLIYYLAQDGFYRFDGASSVPIGVGRVDKWALGRVDPAAREQMRAAHDPVEACVVWCWPLFPQPEGALASAPVSVLLRYAYLEDRWSYELTGSPRGAVVFPGALQSALGVDGWDVVVDSSDVLVDLAEAARDDLVLLSWDFDGSSSTLLSRSGPWAPALLRTSAQALEPDRRVRVSGARALIDAEPATGVEIGVSAQDDQIRTVIGLVTTARPSAANGFAGLRRDGRYFRAQLATDPDTSFSAAQGVDLRFSATGRF